jgi:hypothetical protein
VRIGIGALIVAAVLAGCGGSSDHGSGPRAKPKTLFEHTLARVRDDPTVLASFRFGDIAAQRSLAGVPPAYGAGHPAPRWQRILGVGADYFGQEDPSGKRDGLDILTGSIALDIGQPPHTGGLITGPRVNGGRVRMAVEKLGAVPGTVDGRAGLKWGKEGTLHLNATDQFGTGPGLGEFDRAIITAHTVIAGRYTAEVVTLTGGGTRTAASDPVLAATSACLGDVVAATGQSMTVTGAQSEVSVGVRRPRDAAAPAQEVLCVVPATAGTGPTGTKLCSRVGPHASTLFGSEPARQFVTAAIPENGQTHGAHWSGCVVTDRAAVPAGWLLDVMAHAHDLAGLVAP